MQQLAYRKAANTRLRPVNQTRTGFNTGLQQENINVRSSDRYMNRGTILPAANSVPEYFLIEIALASGTNIDCILFDGDGLATAAAGLTQGSNLTITSGGSAAMYTALVKVLTKEGVQIVGIDYKSSTNDQKVMYVYRGDIDGTNRKTPIQVLPGKSPMQNNQTYLKLDTNQIFDAHAALVVRVASSSEAVTLGFYVATAGNRIS